MQDNFIPECYLDTVLVQTILKTKHINHQKGCPNVIKEITGNKQLRDDFAVGIIDKDKHELDYIINECEEVITQSNLLLFKHRTKQHYFIQLVPAIEVWLLNAAEEGNINVENFGLPKDVNRFKKVSKSLFASENENLKRLCKRLINSDSKTMRTLTLWLQYLFEHNRNADINVLKENV